MDFRLLAADPDPVLLQIYRTYFATFGFDVATAEDGLECVSLLRGFAPDALILNLDLTWGGAEGVLSIVREEEMQPVPVILTVGERNRTKAVRYLAPPVVKLLEKPFRLRDLRAIIESALHSRSSRPSWPPPGAVPESHLIEDASLALSHESLITRIPPEGSSHV